MSVTQSDKLLRQVARRQRLANFGKRLYWCTLVAAGVYAVVLICGRLLSLTDEWYHPWTLALIPAVALLVAALFHRRPGVIDAACLVDRHSRSKDLFLTAALISDGNGEKVPGEYKPLVVDDAERKATGIEPAGVVPWRVWPYVGNVVLAMVVVAAGVLWLPRLDPFGNEQEREKLAQREERLKKEVQLTINRANQLAAKDLKAKRSKPVENAIKDLKLQFDSMKKNDQAANLRKLLDQQQKIGEMWRKASDRKLRESLNSQSVSQRFGAAQSSKMKQMENQLKKGDSSGAAKEIEQIKDLVNQLANTQDAAQKQQLQQEIEKRLQEMSDLSKGQCGSKGLNEALQRALDQMKMSGAKGLSKQAQQALQQSLDLSQLELEQLAQNARDIESLQKALEALQQAKACSRCNKLGEGEGSGGNGLQDYIDMYNKMLADGELKDEFGPGMGGPGRGKGNVAPEDPDQQNKFKTEKSQTHLKAGKIIMQWKTRGLSETGEVKQDYQQSVDEVKEGVSEAMLQEQIPPGYHDAIQKYFDNIEPQSTEAKTEEPK